MTKEDLLRPGKPGPKGNKPNKVRVQVDMHAAIRTALEELAARRGLSVTRYTNELLLENTAVLELALKHAETGVKAPSPISS